VCEIGSIARKKFGNVWDVTWTFCVWCITSVGGLDVHNGWVEDVSYENIFHVICHMKIKFEHAPCCVTKNYYTIYHTTAKPSKVRSRARDTNLTWIFFCRRGNSLGEVQSVAQNVRVICCSDETFEKATEGKGKSWLEISFVTTK